MGRRSSRSASARLRDLADEELMGVVRRGDPDAFEVVYDRHSTAAFTLAYRMHGARGPAEDVVQEAFLSVWRGAASYDPGRGGARTWILGIVRNRAIDALRRSAPHASRRADDEGLAERLRAPEETEEDVVRRDDGRQLRVLLEELPPEQLKVIELAYYGGYSHSEIAEMLDAPIGTVKGRMRLGLDKLRARIVETGSSP